MVKKTKFAMAFHCYQPVFNFEREIERAFKNAYLPLLRSLEEFPGVKASFHYSGNMLEWFERRHPAYIERLKKLMRRKQIEIMGGGCFEPVMALIPEQDRKEQLEMNEEIISRIFGIKPDGAWIAERVWEPALADTLHDAGIKYTIVDDHHMLKAGVKEENIFGPCLTRGKNGSVILFPSLTSLRYLIPFRSPKDILGRIKEIAEKNREDTTCVFFADDGEKFGAWPYTYQWVHKKGWLRDFFRALEENADWLQTATYSEIMNTVSAKEVGDIPESSYVEMMKWSGGNFKNFLKKYPEAGQMHKRMVSVSDMIREMESGDAGFAGDTRIQEAKKELFKAQAGCAYWHGTFGGLYLPHLRSGVYRHLIKARNAVDTLRGGDDKRVRYVEHDLGESRREVVIENKLIDLFVKPALGGGISELDYRPLDINLMNTMSRAREDYHKKLEKNYSVRVMEARKAILRGNFTDIHDVLGVGERGLRKALYYDDYQRNSFLTHVFSGRKPWKEMRKTRTSHDGFLREMYGSRVETGKESVTHTLSRRDRILAGSGGPLDLEVIKRITVGSEPAVTFTHKILKHSGGPAILRYAVEFNFLIWDRTVMSGPVLTETDHFSLKDRYSDVGLRFFLDGKFTVFMYPIHTINETESGLKKMFQGVSVLIGDEYDPDGDSTTDDMKITMTVG